MSAISAATTAPDPARPPFAAPVDLIDLVDAGDGLVAVSDCPRCAGTGVDHSAASPAAAEVGWQLCGCLLDAHERAALGIGDPDRPSCAR